MATYRYTARNKSGANVNGVLEAADEKALTANLRSQGLIPISIQQDKKKAAAGAKKSFSFGKPKVKTQEIVLFARQLATMLDSGIPLVQAMEILTEQIESPTFKNTVMEVRKDITVGLTFYEALNKHKHIFSPLFINMAKAGEASGALDDIMDRLAIYLEKSDALGHKVKSAMNYPIVVSSMAVGITALMLVKVVPVFEAMFSDFGAKLPAPTQFLVNVSHFLQKTILLWIGGGIVGLKLFKRFIKTPKGRFLFHSFTLHMPIFGTIIQKVAVAKFTRTLATLLKSGVPILQALDIVGKSSDNAVIEKAVVYTSGCIQQGESITDPLQRTKVFPALVPRMIAVGEQTGELEKMLNKIADFYDDQVNTAVAGLTSLMEPLIIAFLGVVVGGIVICMFLPIFKMSSAITGQA